MGTTKDPEGFRRHTAGRGDVLGVKGGGPKRRGCGLGLGALLAALLLGAAVWALRGGDERPVAAAASPAVEIRAASEDLLELAAPDIERAVAREVLDPGRGIARHEPARRDSLAVAASTQATLPHRLAAIRLLRGWSDAPLARAEVHWLGREELSRLRANGLRVTTVAFEPVLLRHGRRAVSDDGGLLRVAADGAHLLVQGDGWKRELEVRPQVGDLLDVRVFAPRALLVDVLDWRAQPVRGFPVEFWRVDAGGVPHARLLSSSTSHASGELLLEDVDTLLAPALSRDPGKPARGAGESLQAEAPPLEPTRVRVALDAEMAPDAWQEVDLALDPLPRLRLRLPPLGELSVLVAGADGSPVPWDGHVALRGLESSGRALSGELSEGRAEFANLPFDRALHVSAVRTEGAQRVRGPELTLAPLTPDAPRREIVLSDVQGLPRALVRPIDSHGRAFAGAWVSVQIQGRRALDEDRQPQLGAQDEDSTPSRILWACTLRCDALGQLEFPLPSALLAASDATLALSLVQRGVRLSSQPIALQRGASRDDLDLGLVPLNAPDSADAGSR